jgi:hypothetical protein
MSPPKVDPLKDYTVRLFGLIDGLRPGSAAILQARAVVLYTPPPKSGDTDAENAQPAASLLALAILSPEGQKLWRSVASDPVTLPTD